MAELGDFILETTNAPGTSATINLGGAPAGRRQFASEFGSGTDVYYFMDDGSQAEWGIGHFVNGSPCTLTRTTVLKNTATTTSRLNFLGLTRVYNEIPAAMSLYLDATSSLTRALNNIYLAPSGTTTIASTGALSLASAAGDSHLIMDSTGAEILSNTETRLMAGSGRDVKFSIGGTEAARIDQNRCLLVDCTTYDPIGANVDGFAVRPPSVTGGGPVVVVNAPGSAGIGIGTGALGAHVLEFTFHGSGVVGSVTLSSTATSFNTTSDYRLKTNLEPLERALDRIARLPIYRFNWIGHESEPKVDGMLAHDVAAIVPEAVAGKKDAVHEYGQIIPQSVDFSKLMPLALAAPMELRVMIEALAARVAALEAAI